MALINRQDFINKQASDKNTLVTIDGRKRLYVFDNTMSPVYTKVVPYFVTSLKQDGLVLTSVETVADVTGPGLFHYEPSTNLLTARFFSDADPKSFQCIVTYRFFFASKPCQTSWNLKNVSDEVHWDGRITSSPGYKHKIGIDQALTSLVGEGTLVLKNDDGGLDNIFDTIIFENQYVVVYSWHENLTPEDSKVIYRGRVTNKTFDGVNVKFKIKDELFSLLDAPNIEAYGSTDSVADSVQGQYKRRIYGRVDGVRCQGIDQIGNGYDLNGTVSITSDTNILNGTGTAFLNDLTQGDKVFVSTMEFNVDEVLSDTQAIMSDTADFSVSNLAATIDPENGNNLKNRTFLAAGHICAEKITTVVDVPQFNRVVVADVTGLFEGDFIEFVGTNERIEIKTIAPNNIIVLRQSMIQKPLIGSNVVRRPIQEVYIDGVRANAKDFTVINSGNQCGVVFTTNAEFNLARSSNTIFNGAFTNGSREVTFSNSEVSPSEIFDPGDFIKPDATTYSNYYKITHIKDGVVFLNDVFQDPTITDVVELKRPNYLDDDSVVSVNMLGKTEDGLSTGTWIKTAAQVSRDLLADINISIYNTQSFIDGEESANQLVSMAIPYSFSAKSLPNVKTLVDDLNKSVHSSLTLDNDLLIKFKVLNVFTSETLPIVRDFDVISWKLKSTNGKTYQTALTKYRFKDIDRATLESGNEFLEFSSDFVTNYIETSKQAELDLYIYEERDAEIAAHRFIYYNQLSVTTMQITTDLRLEDLEIGEVVVTDFKRMYKRKGDDVRKKVMLIVGKTVTGEKVTFELSDLGNTFNTSSYITPNSAPEYNLATEDQKLIYGFITDNQGIVDDDEETAGIHLIS